MPLVHDKKLEGEFPSREDPLSTYRLKLSQSLRGQVGNSSSSGEFTGKETPIIYRPEDEFPLGWNKVVRSSDKDIATVIGAGVTLHEALDAYESLRGEGILIRVIDLYSVKPIDEKALRQAVSGTKSIITVEDHYPEGGVGEAIKSVLTPCPVPVYTLAVRKKPKSGKPQELLDYEEISRKAIVNKIRELI
jgi:transketolase